MVLKKSSALENVLGRIDDLDSVSLANLVQRLVRERHFLETVLGVIREGILVIDTQGTVEYLNAAASEMLGIPAKEVGKANLWRSVPNLVRTLHLTREGDISDTTGISREIELSYPERRFGRFYILPMKLGGKGLPDDSPPGFRYAVILSDITEEKLSTRKRIESERVDSIVHLAAGVAHELGNPINSLTIHLQLMRRQLQSARKQQDPEKLLRSVEVCAEEVERLDGIITHFLDAVRPRPPDLSDLDLIQILGETLEFMGPELEDAGISVDIISDARAPVVSGDRNQIKQVFFNVLKNAREAMNPGGRIKVRMKTDDEFVYLMIGDTGIGISEADISRVFQPYYSTKDGGSGLGMMICQRIMREHGGQIGIDSRESVGTLVTLQFPQKHRRIRMLGEGSETES